MAKTTSDFHVLHALQMALISFKGQLDDQLGDESWKKEMHRVNQCEVEAMLYITPDDLSDEGKAQALKGTCNKATDEWDEGITR